MANTSAMPKNMVLFERVAFAGLAFNILSDLLSKQFQELSGILLALLVALSIAIFGGLIWMAGRRRQNWARWVYSILVVLVVMTSIYEYTFTVTVESIWQRLADVLYVLLTAASLYFLWSRDSAAWFRQIPV